MAGLVVEVWTTNSGIFFDNFVIARSLNDAFAFADATWTLKSAAEGSKEKAEKKEKNEKKRDEKSKKGGVKEKAEVKLEELIEFVTENAWATIATVIALSLAIALALVAGEKPKKKVSAPAAAAAPAAPAAAASEGKKDE
jgi:hypothetical protein